MNLGRRLWVWGALVPSAGTLLALVAAGAFFRLHLERSLDQALLAQAAVESISLFDGPDGQPHLHMERSPLLEQVRPFAPSGALYGVDGELVFEHSPTQARDMPARMAPGSGSTTEPRLTTRTLDGVRYRELTLSVRAPDGDPYILFLSASMAQTDAATAAFRWVTLSYALLLALVLVGVQAWQARRLSTRLRALTTHLGHVREGALDTEPPADPAADEISTLRNVLAETTRMLAAAKETRERFIADAAHELRTPLTLMRTSIDLALRRERSPEELREALSDTRREVDRLASLADSLLDLAAMGRGAPAQEGADLRAVVDDAVEAARVEATQNGVRVEVQAAGFVPATFHPGGIRRALDNLLSNALKFSPAGGTVVVRIESEGGRHRITVKDEGPGIPAASREAVFSAFHQVDQSRQGAGLGLAIVREIARIHGGDAWAAPTAKGAEVVFDLVDEDGE